MDASGDFSFWWSDAGQWGTMGRKVKVVDESEEAVEAHNSVSLSLYALGFLMSHPSSFS